MKTIDITGKQWKSRTLRRELERASGDAGPRGRGRGLLADEDKVVDLAAWRAEHLAEPDAPPRAPGRDRSRGPVRRRWRLLDWAELAATLAVAAAFIALAARVLLF